MSTKDYGLAERGGGAGDTGRMRAAILNQITSWWAQAKWQDPEKADRIHEKMIEAPERFISPNPGTDYREEASRIYEEIKQDYSLRTARDLEDTAREYEERAEAYHDRRNRSREFNELAGAPEPTDLPPTKELEPREPELVTRPEPAPEPRAEPIEEPALIERPEPAAPEPEPVREPTTAPDIAADSGFEPGLAAAAAVVGITTFRPTVGGVLRGVGKPLRAAAFGLLLAFGLLVRVGIQAGKLAASVAVWGFWLLLSATIVAVRVLSSVPFYLAVLLAVALPAKRQTAPRVA